VLQLAEQGKVALDDPLTKFFPDYPIGEKTTITVEHLLTHTSGIQSYTSKPSFETGMRVDLPVQELIDSFKNDPMEFAPGERWAYNNSGYILLGAIVEKVSGMNYADYLAKNVYPKAGLTQTAYGDNAPVIPKRIPGYKKQGDRWQNAAYLSMSLPYAAGSLLSSVDDLAKWNAAVVQGRVVGSSLIEKAWTPYTLSSGEASSYGYGWGIGKLMGERMIHHGGGINGFLSMALWLPEHEVFVAVLQNSESGDPAPEFVASQLASFAIGKPWNPVAVTLPAETLAEYPGVYRIDETATRALTLENGKLYSQRTNGPRFEIFPSAKDEFFFARSFTKMTIERNDTGKVIGMKMDTGDAVTRAARTDEKPSTRTEITIDPETLGRYAGRYELAPGFVLTVRRKGNELWSAATGQPEVQLFPESEVKWFLKVVDAQLTFDFDESGNAKSLMLHQGGRNMPAKKVAD
jgi:D-alanyl-D-alanine carboxypeptidase